jgi:hypothetical protein
MWVREVTGAVLFFLFSACGTVHAATLTDAELQEQLASFGADFFIERIEAPTIRNVHDWVNRQAGYYKYQFVEGSDDGDEFQLEKHVPDNKSPDTAWTRHVGDTLVESFVTSDERDVLIVEEIDHKHGFRVVVEPGVHLPGGIEPGAVWEVEADLSVYELEDGSLSNNGKLEALHSYEGAFRIRTPAGEFDTILIREDFLLHVGPLKVDDDRLLFFARGVGLVAEVEGIKASAILIFRMKEHSAKVLVEYPQAVGRTAAGGG